MNGLTVKELYTLEETIAKDILDRKSTRLNSSHP